MSRSGLRGRREVWPADEARADVQQHSGPHLWAAPVPVAEEHPYDVLSGGGCQGGAVTNEGGDLAQAFSDPASPVGIRDRTSRPGRGIRMLAGKRDGDVRGVAEEPGTATQERDHLSARLAGQSSRGNWSGVWLTARVIAPRRRIATVPAGPGSAGSAVRRSTAVITSAVPRPSRRSVTRICTDSCPTGLRGSTADSNRLPRSPSYQRAQVANARLPRKRTPGPSAASSRPFTSAA